jgi:hypothetical protein
VRRRRRSRSRSSGSSPTGGGTALGRGSQAATSRPSGRRPRRAPPRGLPIWRETRADCRAFWPEALRVEPLWVSRLEQLIEAVGVRPAIIGELGDSALLTAFGQSGVGLFPVAAVWRARCAGCSACASWASRVASGIRVAVDRSTTRTTSEPRGTVRRQVFRDRREQLLAVVRRGGRSALPFRDGESDRDPSRRQTGLDRCVALHLGVLNFPAVHDHDAEPVVEALVESREPAVGAMRSRAAALEINAPLPSACADLITSPIVNVMIMLSAIDHA